MATIKQYVFFDFEMLCSKRAMPFAEMEAIRLGAVKYDLQTKEIETFDQYIRPTTLEPLSDFCKSLTGIQDSDLDQANGFPTVFGQFLDWINGVKKTRFFSWSTSDLLRLQHDAQMHNIPVSTIAKIEKRYIDFQEIFTKKVSKTNHSVENALGLYNLEFVGETHNPMYDSYNTLQLYINFTQAPKQSELIMLKQFIFIDKDVSAIDINTELKYQFKQDIQDYLTDLKIIHKIRDAKKLIKRTKKIVHKYENIITNRAGLYDSQIIEWVKELLSFYLELMSNYEYHLSYGSKIVILHEQLIKPLHKLTA
ncbi:3'-5' exonuclease [Bacillus sp. Marseille-P3661]|uniref:3'-5' exonuclease n=1 Tax=Bacillus sp. Marseille-P3661 TaxID=1936234 RepID=UPI000C845759|nr:3'-5' exonuclease [Bacillus sp. Marseille-P3661]